ncbi:hypothetical protein C8R43DRAFT_1139775 [Mycena crocata]|nr:hypothetical protein C8R43DRAFT_1139775 [Mycena crocata]
MESPDSGVIHVSPTNASGFNIVDEIPVDLVANIILLHMLKGTNGIVHAGAKSYTPRRLWPTSARTCHRHCGHSAMPWTKKETKEYLAELEHIKSLLHVWLALEIMDNGHMHKRAQELNHQEQQQDHERILNENAREQQAYPEGAVDDFSLHRIWPNPQTHRLDKKKSSIGSAH